jgi:hypothetical protein
MTSLPASGTDRLIVARDRAKANQTRFISVQDEPANAFETLLQRAIVAAIGHGRGEVARTLAPRLEARRRSAEWDVSRRVLHDGIFDFRALTGARGERI